MRRSALILLGLLLVTACGQGTGSVGTGSGAGPTAGAAATAAPAEPSARSAAPSPSVVKKRPTAAARASAPPRPAAPAGWTPYRDEKLGYTAAYPRGWKVRRAAGATTFIPAQGSGGISVQVKSGAQGPAGGSDLPNTKCRRLMVGGRDAVSCLDTMSLSTVTTVEANGRTYAISTRGKAANMVVYERFLGTVRFVKR